MTAADPRIPAAGPPPTGDGVADLSAGERKAQERKHERRALGVGSGAHALHDGYTDIIFVMLPLWQAEFGLSYAAVGALRTVYSGTMATFQMPSTWLADRLGAPLVLAAGTALAGLCYVLAGTSNSFALLVAALFLGGLGAATQHPIASALIARAFAGPRAITALGTYNFAGDMGKMALPALAAAMLWAGLAWRPTVGTLGLAGLGAALVVFLLMPRFAPEEPAAAAKDAAQETGLVRAAKEPLSRGYWLLLATAFIDATSRAAFMVFLPFLLIAKGATPATAGMMLTLVFGGGAVGKLVCAWIGARFGIVAALVITEILTAAGIFGVLYLPLTAAVLLLPVLGVVLNGTSSLTYGSIPLFITPAQRNHAFGVFYTGTIGAGAIAPTLGGLAGDIIGKEGAVMLAAALALAALPLVAVLRRHMRAMAST